MRQVGSFSLEGASASAPGPARHAPTARRGAAQRPTLAAGGAQHRKDARWSRREGGGEPSGLAAAAAGSVHPGHWNRAHRSRRSKPQTDKTELTQLVKFGCRPVAPQNP